MKHNILWGIILLVASLSFTAKAQKAVQGQFSVKGVLLDSLSNEGEPYSTIRISLKNNPAKPVKLAVTGADGRFDERLAVPGTYLIHFTSVGKSPVQKEFSISANRRNVDLGKILIAEATEMLKGVEVVAQKPLVKAEIDKVTYSIEDDPDSKTNTTLEMLRKVPLVTVDGEDKIQVNGSSKFKVHVNGKPNNMMSNNPTEVLRSMPANSIKSIEVITEPGAKYDAEGVAGILNIITIGAGMEGYTVTLNGGCQGSSLLALVENLQRRDLNFVEEATALAKLIETYHLSQEEAARRIGKSQSAVANKLRLLRLPPDVLTLLRERGCTERHARALLRLEEPELLVAQATTWSRCDEREIGRAHV